MGGRMCVHGAYCTTWVYTPEVYPTNLRSTGLGVAAGISKGASIITPYVANLLIGMLFAAGRCCLGCVEYPTTTLLVGSGVYATKTITLLPRVRGWSSRRVLTLTTPYYY